MTALTKRQSNLLNFIKQHMAENEGTPPSFDEMREGMGLASKSGVHRLINALVERNFIARIPNRARCIEVIERPGLKHDLRVHSTHELAAEARRRGLVLGYIKTPVTGHDPNGEAQRQRIFQELRA